MDSLAALVAEAEALDKAATPGPWRSYLLRVIADNVGLGLQASIPMTEQDSAFIARARTLLPALAAALRPYLAPVGLEEFEGLRREHHYQCAIVMSDPCTCGADSHSARVDALRAAHAAALAELATLRARLAERERERDEARTLVAEAQSTLDVLRTIADRLAKSSPLDYDGNCVTCGMDEGDDSHAFDCAWAIAAALHGDAPRNWKGEWLDAVRALAAKGGA